MSALSSGEAAVLTFLADMLDNNAATIEADLGPVEVVAVGDFIKLTDPIWAKLPFGIGGLIDAAFAKYSPILVTTLSTYVGTGIVNVIAFLRAAAAHVAANP
jgi:hypothetical protein